MGAQHHDAVGQVVGEFCQQAYFFRVECVTLGRIDQQGAEGLVVVD